MVLRYLLGGALVVLLWVVMMGFDPAITRFPFVIVTGLIGLVAASLEIQRFHSVRKQLWWVGSRVVCMMLGHILMVGLIWGYWPFR